MGACRSHRDLRSNSLCRNKISLLRFLIPGIDAAWSSAGQRGRGTACRSDAIDPSAKPRTRVHRRREAPSRRALGIAYCNRGGGRSIASRNHLALEITGREVAPAARSSSGAWPEALHCHRLAVDRLGEHQTSTGTFRPLAPPLHSPGSRPPVKWRRRRCPPIRGVARFGVSWYEVPCLACAENWCSASAVCWRC